MLLVSVLFIVKLSTRIYFSCLYMFVTFITIFFFISSLVNVCNLKLLISLMLLFNLSHHNQSFLINFKYFSACNFENFILFHDFHCNTRILVLISWIPASKNFWIKSVLFRFQVSCEYNTIILIEASPKIKTP